MMRDNHLLILFTFIVIMLIRVVLRELCEWTVKESCCVTENKRGR